MNRNLMVVVAAIVLVVAACSGGSDTGSATTSEASDATATTAATPAKTDTTVATTSGNQEQSGERSAAKDAAFRLSFPITSLTGGKVVATSDGSTRTLDIFYPATVRDNLITFYTIWNKGLDNATATEGPPVYTWEGVDVGGAAATVTMSPDTVGGVDGWMVSLQWEG